MSDENIGTQEPLPPVEWAPNYEAEPAKLEVSDPVSLISIYSEDIGILWSKVAAEDKEEDSRLNLLTNVGGDVKKYVSSKIEWYEIHQPGHETDGHFTIMKYLYRIRKAAI